MNLRNNFYAKNVQLPIDQEVVLVKNNSLYLLLEEMVVIPKKKRKTKWNKL